jgi:hypothetical protein
MKLVVEISEDIYKTLKTVTNIVYGFRSGKTLVHACLTAIRNGIPLDEHEKAYRDLLNAISKEITSLPSELTEDGRRLIRRGDVFRIIEQYRGEEDGSI